MNIPDKVKIEEIMKELQKIMRIQDWDIEIEIEDKYYTRCEMNADHYDTAAFVTKYLKRNEATITFNKDHTQINDEWYECLIHELMHIVTANVVDVADEYIESEDIQHLLTKEKELLVVKLQKIFTVAYPVTNFIKGGENIEENQKDT